MNLWIIWCIYISSVSSSSSLPLPLSLSFSFFCIAALEIIQMPRSQAIQEGRKLVLSCRTRSLPDVSYRWIKDDIEIPGANRSDLVLEPVRMHDFGRYFCRVWDKSGSLTSEPADVDIFPSPHMSKYGQWRIQGRAPGGLLPPPPYF